MTATITVVGVPVRSIRQWTYAQTEGYYVEMTCQAGSNLPSQWTVVKLSDGSYTIQHGPAGVYANSNFGAGGAHGGDMNQIRDPEGKIWFVLQNPLGPELRIAVFQPLTGKVFQLSDLVDRGAPDALVYSATFNADGSKLYLGGQSSHTRAPTIWQVDTRTMDMDLIGHAGFPATTGITYAYYLAVDRDHLYVAVGQNPWQLVSINLTTRAQTTLITTSGQGFQWMEFEARSSGVSVHYYDNGVPSRQWVADGVLYPYGDGSNPPFEPRNVRPYANPLPANTPQIDASRGAGVVLTRPAGSTGAWREIRYDVANEVPVEIESLVALPDGSLLGSTRQYGGFFRVRADGAEWYGAWRGVSQPCHVAVGDKSYFCGYPNGALYRFDPTPTWDVDANPVLLGSYHATSLIKYPYFIRESGGALYCAGRCERDSVGSAVGRCDLALGAFTGTNLNLSSVAAPRGFVVLADLGLIVLGGDGGQVVHFDTNMIEVSRSTLDGAASTGELFRTSTPNVLLGVAPGAAYHYDVATSTVIERVAVDTPTAPWPIVCAQAPDGMVWYVSASKRLKMIDSTSLLVVDVADLSAYEAVRVMAWSGGNLYLAAGATLLKVSDL